ncbi:MAG: hypothetical protein PHF97_06210 [Bacteroidales bacterium]|nr:hypothetical protein [Bacteroidales bacterium]MDD4603382.1 hypothetical protein [Bacteroidales bacterium]
MKVRINRHAMEIFDGATVGDAILAHSQWSFRKMMEEKLIPYDRFGNVTEPGGAISEGQIIFLKKPKHHV